MSTHVTIHRVVAVKAHAPGSLGAPLYLSLVTEDNVSASSVTILLNDQTLVDRLVDAINGAAEHKCAPDLAHQEAHDAVHTAYAYRGSCR